MEVVAGAEMERGHVDGGGGGCAGDGWQCRPSGGGTGGVESGEQECGHNSHACGGHSRHRECGVAAPK